MGEDGIISVSLELDQAGLVWNPEIGDEVAERTTLEKVSILVDPRALTVRELRGTFVWLPTVEQLVKQFEARQALIYHVGVTNKFTYEAVVKTNVGIIEANAESLRLAFGRALQELLKGSPKGVIH